MRSFLTQSVTISYLRYFPERKREGRIYFKTAQIIGHFLLGASEITANLYCNYIYLYWEGCVFPCTKSYLSPTIFAKFYHITNFFYYRLDPIRYTDILFSEDRWILICCKIKRVLMPVSLLGVSVHQYRRVRVSEPERGRGRPENYSNLPRITSSGLSLSLLLCLSACLSLSVCLSLPV